MNWTENYKSPKSNKTIRVINYQWRRVLRLKGKLFLQTFKLNSPTHRQESCLSCVFSFVDFISQKTEGHLPWTTTNWVLSKDDVKRDMATETTTSREKLPPSHDIIFTGFYKYYWYSKYKSFKIEYRFCSTFKIQRLLVVMVIIYVNKWASCNFTCTDKIVSMEWRHNIYFMTHPWHITKGAWVESLITYVDKS